MSGWVSVEGGNAVGKTYLAGRAAQRLGPRCLPLVELPDQPPATLPAAVITALAAGGDAFLRGGYPRTETLLLAALQAHRYESADPAGRVVLEDRGPHTVAIYQATILSPHASDTELLAAAHAILALIGQWRPLPDQVVLVRDTSTERLTRFTRRMGRPPRPDERHLMDRATRLYDLAAACDPATFHIIDRALLTEEQAVQAIIAAVDAVAAHHRTRNHIRNREESPA